MEEHNVSEDEFVGQLSFATRQGDDPTLENVLSTLPDSGSYLNRTYDQEDKQKCTLLTIACLNGHEHVVRLLLRHGKVNLEVLNDVVITIDESDRQLFGNVSVLWTAATLNQFSIVQVLVEHGAHVNHTTETHSTPLRAACYNGNVDMARYLIAHGADIHITKKNNDTNLMVAVCQNHLHMVTYLVDELGCDVNVQDNDGRSALYDAVRSDSLELVEFLLARGAHNFRANIDQMSPLLWAAERRRPDLMEAIATRCSMLERIEALELLGSAFVCDIRHDSDLPQAFTHFHRALELRTVHRLSKPLRESIDDIFGGQQECQTVEEMENIQSNLDSMYVEALLVRERLLGTASEEYHRSVCYRGAMLADKRQYQEATSYWMYELNLCRQHSIVIDAQHLRNFAALFSWILHETTSLPIEALLVVIKATTDELEHGDREKFDYSLCTLLFLITITSQLVVRHPTASSAERMAFYRHVRAIVRRNYATLDSGRSLLHLAVDNHTPIEDDDIKLICEYPCLPTIWVLLQSGAEVNAVDAIRNTPLHLLTASVLRCDEAILDLLCQAGAHLDYVNDLGERPIDMAPNLATRNLLQSRTRLSLKCLCARLIRKEDIAFHCKLGSSLCSFVEQH